jgi:hypothetical protein
MRLLRGLRLCGKRLAGCQHGTCGYDARIAASFLSHVCQRRGLVLRIAQFRPSDASCTRKLKSPKLASFTACSQIPWNSHSSTTSKPKSSSKSSDSALSPLRQRGGRAKQMEGGNIMHGAFKEKEGFKKRREMTESTC